MKLSFSIITATLTVVMLYGCRGSRDFSVDKNLYGKWEIDSVFTGKPVELKILPDYLKEMKQIFTNASMEFGKDNTFVFILAGNRVEGTWFTSADEKYLITRGFGERNLDSFLLELPGKDRIKLTWNQKYPLIIFLKRE